MSIDTLRHTSLTPRTVVPSGITDPVERARAELKAALAAIEHKANLPARAAEKIEAGAVKARAFARRQPAAAAAGAVGVALALGAAIWGLARLISR
ncbi:hypothetical protein [Microbacterium sp. Root53]|uniref:hypothetical protein n=1 Tax=Microbacterium sp. Root53 TaxID=1736553 RepID=UPI0006F9EC11|nr:hypothetical protein [Microbacterium sp. Root53]KQZ11770.1 hypothetical protein ASD19_00335 [Microbacterium sp. Root53]